MFVPRSLNLAAYTSRRMLYREMSRWSASWGVCLHQFVDGFESAFDVICPGRLVEDRCPAFLSPLWWWLDQWPQPFRRCHGNEDNFSCCTVLLKSWTSLFNKLDLFLQFFDFSGFSLDVKVNGLIHFRSVWVCLVLSSIPFSFVFIVNKIYLLLSLLLHLSTIFVLFKFYIAIFYAILLCSCLSLFIISLLNLVCFVSFLFPCALHSFHVFLFHSSLLLFSFFFFCLLSFFISCLFSPLFIPFFCYSLLQFILPFSILFPFCPSFLLSLSSWFLSSLYLPFFILSYLFAH